MCYSIGQRQNIPTRRCRGKRRSIYIGVKRGLLQAFDQTFEAFLAGLIESQKLILNGNTLQHLLLCPSIISWSENMPQGNALLQKYTLIYTKESSCHVDYTISCDLLMEIHTTAILIYPNIVNTLVRKYALGQCPAPKIYPHTHKRVFLSCTSYLFL